MFKWPTLTWSQIQPIINKLVGHLNPLCLNGRFKHYESNYIHQSINE